MSEEKKKATATEVLMKVMEEFSQEEPEDIVVVYTTESRVCCRKNLPDEYAIGLLRVAEYTMLTKG